MEIRNEVRAAEKNLNEMTTDKSEQLQIITAAQSLSADAQNREHYLTVLAIVKNRVIRGC